jgi:hypothetical protein
VPEDTFVSIRIGDVHKQTRFVASRSHRFPEACAREGFARVEVFKRLGTAIVDFQGNEVGDYLCAAAPVDVDCDYPGLSKLSWQLSVKRPLAPGSPGKAPTAAPERKQPIQRLNSAQQYLRDNNLEVHLANVVQELLKVRPKDPHAFVSSRMNDLRERPPSRGTVLPPLQRKGTTQDIDQRLPDSMPPALPPKSLPPIQRRDLSPAGIRKARDLSPAGLKSVKSAPSLPPKASGSRAGTPSQGVAHVTDKENLYAQFPAVARTKEKDHRSKPAAVEVAAPAEAALFSSKDFETTMRAQQALGWVGPAELEKTQASGSRAGTPSQAVAHVTDQENLYCLFPAAARTIEKDHCSKPAAVAAAVPVQAANAVTTAELEDAKGKARDALLTALCAPPSSELEDAKARARDALLSALCPPSSGELEDAKGKAREALCAALSVQEAPSVLPAGELESAKGKAREALCAALFTDEEKKAQRASGWVEAAELEKKLDTAAKAPMSVKDLNTNCVKDLNTSFDGPIATFGRQLYSLFPSIERVAEKSRPDMKSKAPIPESVASIRSQVKSSLLQSARNGRLAEVIKSDPLPPDVASTKLAVQTLLVKAARDGSLAESMRIEDDLARTFLPKELPPAPPPREETIRGIDLGDTESAAKQIPQRTGLLPSAPKPGEQPGMRSRTVVLESTPLTDSYSAPVLSAPGSPDLRSRTALLLLPPPEVAPMVPLSGPAEYAPTRLRVVIQRATGLRDADVMTLSEPYCVLEVRGRNQTLHRRFHTKVIDNDLYPIWNEKYDFDYEMGDELSFSIWSKDSNKPDNFLGVVNLKDDLFLPNGFEGHVVLSDCGEQWWLDEARLYLKIRPAPPSSPSQQRVQPSLTTSVTLA